MTNYRILDKNYNVKYTGTNTGSWFSLEDAKNLVNYSNGEKVYQYDMNTMRRIGEVL